MTEAVQTVTRPCVCHDDELEPSSMQPARIEIPRCARFLVEHYRRFQCPEPATASGWCLRHTPARAA